MLYYERVPGTNKCVSTASPSTGTDVYHTWTLPTHMEIIIILIWLFNESWQVGCNLANNRIFGEYIYSTSIIRWGWKSAVLVLGINRKSLKQKMEHQTSACLIHMSFMFYPRLFIAEITRCLHVDPTVSPRHLGAFGWIQAGLRGLQLLRIALREASRCVANGNHGGLELNMEKCRISMISTYRNHFWRT